MADKAKQSRPRKSALQIFKDAKEDILRAFEAQEKQSALSGNYEAAQAIKEKKTDCMAQLESYAVLFKE